MVRQDEGYITVLVLGVVLELTTSVFLRITAGKAPDSASVKLADSKNRV